MGEYSNSYKTIVENLVLFLLYIFLVYAIIKQQNECDAYIKILRSA